MNADELKEYINTKIEAIESVFNTKVDAINKRIDKIDSTSNKILFFLLTEITALAGVLLALLFGGNNP